MTSPPSTPPHSANRFQHRGYSSQDHRFSSASPSATTSQASISYSPFGYASPAPYHPSSPK
jgi:hypothetical protein